MPADVAITESEIRVRFHRRSHLPIVLASGLIDKPVAVPWWNGRALRIVQYPESPEMLASSRTVELQASHACLILAARSRLRSCV